MSYEIYERRSSQQARNGKVADILIQSVVLYLAFLVGWNVGLRLGEWV